MVGPLCADSFAKPEAQDNGSLFLFLVLIFIAEDFSSEGLDGCALLPGVWRQSSFAAGLFEEGGAVPLALDRDLREEKPAATVVANEEAVATNFDGFWKNRPRRRENAQLDLQVNSFFLGDWRKAAVIEGGGPRTLRDGAVKGRCGQHIADTSAQLARKIQRSEGAARFC